MVKKRLFVINPDLCTGCRTCEIACSLSHEKECNTRKSRIKIIKYEESGIDIPTLCQDCRNPVCRAVCPTKAISKDPETGKVSIDYEKCSGCELCAAVCPFGAPTLIKDGNRKKAIICDLCGGDPNCVRYCDTKAIRFVDASEESRKAKVDGMKKIIYHTNPHLTRINDSRILKNALKV